MSLKTRSGQATIINAYAPTLKADPEAKAKFYDDIHRLLLQIPAENQLFVLGDFNARVGKDQEVWPSCLGNFGTGKMNDNGQRLLELCADHSLCVTNTFFKCKPRHQVSWMHPRSRHWHQLDVVLTRRKSLNSVNLTRSYPSADCNTDHSIVISQVKLVKKRHIPEKQKRNPS